MRVICMCLMILLLAQHAFAACSGASPTWTAANTSFTEVSACVTAASTGDTINIPAGSSTWTSKITLTKSVNLIGAGPDSTIITDNVSGGGILHLQSATGTVRISNFQVTGTLGGFNGTIRVDRNDTRVDNMKFTLTNGRHALRVFGHYSNVVFDHNDFGSGSRGININGTVAAYWDTAAAYAPGTAQCIYAEDNIFRARNAEVIDVQQGGCYVARYNQIVDGGNFTMHGADSGDRSGGYAEIYENIFTNPGAQVSFATTFRGGNQIIYNNTFTGLYTSVLNVRNYRSCFTENTALVFHANNQNDCQHNSVNPLDGDFSPEDNGWPCKDQIGRGPNQSSKPSYEWNNLRNGAAADWAIENLGGCSNPSTLDHIQLGRDLFNDTEMPGYTAYTYPHPLTGGTPSPPTDLLGHWKFDETSGLVASDELALNPGTLVNLDSTAAHVLGNQGRAVACDSDGYMTIPDAAMLDMAAGQDFTVMIRVLTTQAAAADVFPAIVGKVDTDGTRDEWLITLNASNDPCPTCRWHGRLRASNVLAGCSGTETLRDGHWHHLAIVREGTTLRCFHNGVFTNGVTSATVDDSLTNAHPIRLCQSNITSPEPSQFIGRVDDFRLYDRALPLAEIAAIAGEGDPSPKWPRGRGRVKWSGAVRVK